MSETTATATADRTPAGVVIAESSMPLVLIAWARRRHNAELLRLLRRRA
ncbi:hypothetical protein ACWCQ0_07865 [Streptomyces massasporeus]